MPALQINGKRQNVDGVDPRTPLLWVVRDHLGLTGTKFGCGIGQCGTCSVHVDGATVRACQISLGEVGDREVTTIEGLSEDGSHPLQRSWAEANVPQCGYCQTGQIMAAAALLNEEPDPDDEEIDAVMEGNICRCGTYQRIRQAIHMAAERQS